MTAQAPDARPQPDPAWPLPGRAYPPGQHWCQGNANRGPRALRRAGADPVRDDPVVIDLVTRARRGDKRAWDVLIMRYAPLVWSICRRHRLGDADAEDVGQSVWLRLVDQLGQIRDPAALPGGCIAQAGDHSGGFCRGIGCLSGHLLVLLPARNGPETPRPSLVSTVAGNPADHHTWRPTGGATGRAT